MIPETTDSTSCGRAASPTGSTTPILDYGNDDYYNMPASDTWWDVQDSAWLRHLNAPTYTLDLTPGVGVASTASDLPGVDCAAKTHCVSTLGRGHRAYAERNAGEGLCARAVGWRVRERRRERRCSVSMTGNQAVTVAFLKSLALAAFTAPTQVGARVQVKLTLSRAPLAREASITCRATAGLRLVAHTINGTIATCAWSIPARLHGRRVTGRITVNGDNGSALAHAWSLKLRR